MSSSKTFAYIGQKNHRLDPETNDVVEIVPRFRGYDFPKGEAVEVTDPVAIAKLSANPDFEEVKEAKEPKEPKGGRGGKGKTDKPGDTSDDKGADADKPTDQSGAGDAPAA